MHPDNHQYAQKNHTKLMVNNIGNWQHDKWSVHTASTIGSLTHRHFWRWKKNATGHQEER